MSMPNKPNLGDSTLDLKDTFGGNKTTYSQDDINNGYGVGTPLGQKLKSEIFNHNLQYDIEWIKYVSDAIDYITANVEAYTDSGTANAIILTIDTGEARLGYENDMRVRFFKNGTNTGATTINVDGLGVKNVRNPDGTALDGNEFLDGRYYELIYDSSNNYFVETVAQKSDPISNLIKNSQSIYTAPSETNEGLSIYSSKAYELTKTDGDAGKEPNIQQIENSKQAGVVKRDTIIEVTAGDQPALGIINDNAATTQINDISYENLTVKGRAASSSSDCIHIQYTDDYKVENCNLENAGRDGVYIGSPFQAYNPPKCLKGKIRDNICKNNTRWDVSLLHGDDLVIDSNYFEAGVDIEPTTSTAENRNIKITNNTLDGGLLQLFNTKRNNDGSTLGILGSITASTNTLAVTDATHLEVGEFIGIAGTTPSFFQITNIAGNTVTLHTNADSTVTGGAISTFLQLRDVLIANNFMKGADGVSFGAIRCYLATHLNVLNNYIYNCDGDGMSLDRISHSTIMNNKIIREVASPYYGEDYGIFLTRNQNKVIGNHIEGYEIGIRASRGIGSDTEYKPYQISDDDFKNIIAQNHIKVNGEIGIWLQTQSDLSSVVSGNIIERVNTENNSDVNSAGIYVKSVSTVISDNIVKGNFYYGVRLFSEAEDCVIENNIINGVVSNYITDAGVHNKINGYYIDAGTPSVGTWIVGDEIKTSTTSKTVALVCTASGTAGTLNGGATTGSITSGTNVLTLSSTTGLRPLRNFITIAGVTGVFEIIKLDGTTAYLNKNADATVSSAAVAFNNPTFA